MNVNRTLALLRPSSTATKEREAAEKARREAEERAAGIEPKVEESKDDKKDEKNERPKIVWFKPVCFEELLSKKLDFIYLIYYIDIDRQTCTFNCYSYRTSTT